MDSLQIVYYVGGTILLIVGSYGIFRTLTPTKRRKKRTDANNR